ncbi:hypothetical protein [Dactylosporangium sp. NPDC049140]|uniref:hypothetical protein n=1 Tax=Dactylosporangium sp. NPDC049140 TaxID=3155647 RepID=UPI0033DF25D2
MGTGRRRSRLTEGLELFDDGLAVLATAAILVTTAGCFCRWSWVMPADEGAGPYRTAARVHGLVVLLIVLGVAALVCVVRGYVSESGVPMYSAAALLALGGVFALGLYAPHDEADIVADGFGYEWYSTSVDGRFSFYNTTAAPITICLGISGDCDAGAKGPDRLRSPGLTIPPNHRLAIDTPKAKGDYRLTLVGAGFTHRDTILNLYVPDNNSVS